MKRLETDRLILRPWAKEDADDLFAYAKLMNVGPKAGWKPHENKHESLQIIKKFIQADDTWAIESKESKRVIGSVGLHEKQPDPTKKTLYLGYVLSPDWQGMGLMTEACEAVVRHAFFDLDVKQIISSHFIGNDKSERVLKRLGFRYERKKEYETVSYGILPSKAYRLTHEHYILGGTKMNTWNLDILYTGFDDERLKKDEARFDGIIEKMRDFEEVFAGEEHDVADLIAYLNQQIEYTELADKLFHFAMLKQSTHSTDQEAVKYLNRLQTKTAALSKVETMFKQWLKRFPDIGKAIEKDDFLQEHAYYLSERIEEAKHLLDEDTEQLIAKLRQSGSTAWSRLQSLLTSTLAVDYEGDEKPLSEVRNLAYDKDPETRKKAYQAELAAYEKIDKPIAFSLNAIKGEVNTLSEERGYASPFEQTLIQSRMKKETLDAMLEAMRGFLPSFRKYLKRKASLLGHEDGLPFYDLFAPVGDLSRTFTVEEAKDYILRNFGSFSKRLHDMAKRAFEEEWIDFFPKKGKVGGAFCANIPSIKESRVLTNFTGSFSDVITLSHELGHAYHGEAIFGESILNTDYTMPVAETASTFCETIVKNAALADSGDEDEKIYLLESSLQDSTQVIVDIMSRYLFEKAVFEGRKDTLFDEKELKDMMLDAQKKTYGDGLDPQCLHPYMWVCKGHYYSGGLSYYNFPYAYGLLFAKGLYAKYLEDREAFVGLYDKLLASTGKMNVEDVAKIADIDVTQKAFWVDSLNIIKKDIDRFLELTE